MIHHTCEHALPEIPIIRALSDGKATVAVMGYDGRYRCGECKRRVLVRADGDTWQRDLAELPRAEPPYPDGWCGPSPSDL